MCGPLLAPCWTAMTKSPATSVRWRTSPSACSRAGRSTKNASAWQRSFEGTGAGTWEWNVQTGETRFNERWAEIVGATLDELSPTTIQTWADLAHPEDMARSGALLQAHFAGETAAYECEARMRHRDGHWVWVLDRGKLLTPHRRRPARMDVRHPPGHHRAQGAGRTAAQERGTAEPHGRPGAGRGLGGGHRQRPASTGPSRPAASTAWSLATSPNWPKPSTSMRRRRAPSSKPPWRRPWPTARAGTWNCPSSSKGGRNASGCVRWATPSSKVGKPVRLFGAFQDITRRVQDRRRWRPRSNVSHWRPKVVASASGNWNVQTGVLTWDALMYALYGLPRGIGYGRLRALGSPPSPRRSQPGRAGVQVALESGADFRSEFRVVWADGSVHHLCASGRIVTRHRGPSPADGRRELGRDAAARARQPTGRASTNCCA